MNILPLRLRHMCLIALILTGFSARGKEINLVPNGEFGTPIGDGEFWKLNKGTVQEKGDAYKGDTCIKITRTNPRGNLRYSLESDFIPYTKGPLAVSAWWKGEKITQGKQSWHKALFHIYYFDQNRKTVGSHSAIASLSGDSNWKECKRTYYPTSDKKDKWHTIPDGTKFVKIEFLLLDCTGILWIDDVKVISEEVPKVAAPVKTASKASSKADPTANMTADQKAEYQRLLLATRKKKKNQKVHKDDANLLIFDDVKLSPAKPWDKSKYPNMPEMEVKGGDIYLDGKPSMMVGVETHFRLYPFMYKLLGLDFAVLAISDAGHTKLDKLDERTYKVSWEKYKWLGTMLDSLAQEGIWSYIDFWMGGIPVKKKFPEMMIQDPPQHFIDLRMTNKDSMRYIDNYSKSIAEYSRNYPVMGYEFLNEIMYTSPYHPDNLKIFRREMVEKYGSIYKANQVWGTSFSSFAEVVPPKKGGVSGLTLTLPKNYSPTLFNDYTKFSERLLTGHISNWRKDFRKYEPNGMTFVQAIYGMWMDYGNKGVNPELLIESEDALGCEAGITFIPQPEGSEDLALIKNMTMRVMARDVLRSASPNKPLIDGESPLSVGMPPPSKSIVDIHGTWKFKSIAKDRGFSEKKRFFDADDSNPDKSWTRVDYDDSNWSDMKVPSLWGEGGFKNTYIALYRKNFKVTDYDGPVFLSGKRLSDYAHVYVNGTLVRKTKMWSEEFCADISDYINRGGDNVIAVRIYNKYFGGGMYWGGIRGSIKLGKSSTKMIPLTPGQMRSYLWASALHGYSGTAITYFYSGQGIDYPFSLFNPRYISLDAIKTVPVVKKEIESVADIVLPRPRIKGKVGLMYPYEAFRYNVHPDAVKMLEAPLSKDLLDYYQALLFSQIPVDMVSSKQILEDKTNNYQALLFRMASMAKPGVVEKVQSYVENGGIAIIDHGSLEKEDKFYSAVDLSKLTGIKTGQPFAEQRSVSFNNGLLKEQNTVKRLSDDFNGINVTNISAEVIASYADGTPAVTVKKLGDGLVYYIGCELPYNARKSLLNTLLKQNGIEADLKISSDDNRGGFVEGHMFTKDKRQVWVFNNWGEKANIKITPATDKLCGANYKVRELVSGDVVKSPSQTDVWSREQLLAGVSMEMPSQDPRILIVEEEGTDALERLTLSENHQKVLDKTWERSPEAKTKILVDCLRNTLYCKVRTPSLTWLLEDQGYQILTGVSRLGQEIKYTNKDIISDASLSEFDVLMLPGIAGVGQVRGYSDKELEVIKNFVKNGGGLFLSGQFHRGPHGHMSSGYASKVAEMFGVKILRAAVNDKSSHIMNEPRYITTDNITTGELGNGVSSFQSMGIAPLKFSGLAGEAVVSSSDKATAPGYNNGNVPVIAAVKYGKGRVVIAGDASWLQAYALKKEDNAQLALNIINWLSQRPVEVMDKESIQKKVDVSLD